MADLDEWRAEDEEILREHEANVTKAALTQLNDLAKDLRALLRDENLSDADVTRAGEAWQMALDSRILPAIEDAYVAAYLWQTDSLTAAVSDDAQANARAYIKTIRNRLVGVADEIFKDIRRELAEGMEANETGDQLAARIDRIFAERGGNNWLGRASVIAQTETAAAINAGRLQAARKFARDNKIAPALIRKTWVTRSDDLVRPAHKAVHGTTVPLTRPFDVAGVKMNAPGDPTAPPELTINCRCTLRLAIPSSIRAGGEMAEETETTEVLPWHGVLAPEGVLSGDRRKFAPESLRHRDLPLPLLYQDATAEGHDGAVRVGRIDGITRATNGDGTPEMRAWGVMDTNENATEAARQIQEQMLRGVSVDVDDATFEFQDDEGNDVGDMSPFEMDNPVMVVTDGRIAGATLCSIPAFQEAYVSLGLPPAEWELGEVDTSAADEEMIPVEAVVDTETFESVSDKPWGDFTQADYDDDQWYRATVLHKNGNSRAKGDNGLPIREPDGTLNRNAVHAAAARFNQVDAPAAAKSSAKSALRGAYKAIGEDVPDALAAAGGTVAPSFTARLSLVASGSLSDFSDPMLTAPTPLTVTADGRVFGHLATWGTCHLSFDQQCITPPSSAAAYAYFTTGEVLTADGATIPVGQITLGTGHAAANLGPRPAIEHYDNTGSAVADVAAGEDGHGIWIAGRVRPGLSPDRLDALRAAALSGDWRRIGGSLELVAALAVNTPGFPIPRVRTAMVAGAQTALVASAVVTHGAEESMGDEIERRLRQVLRVEREQQRRVQRAARIAASIQRDRASRAALANSLVHG